MQALVPMQMRARCRCSGTDADVYTDLGVETDVDTDADKVLVVVEEFGFPCTGSREVDQILSTPYEHSGASPGT